MRFLKRLSVRARLTLWSVCVLALALIVFGAALRSIVQVNLNAAINRSLVQQARDHQAMTLRQFEPRPDGFVPSPEPPGPGPGGFGFSHGPGGFGFSHGPGGFGFGPGGPHPDGPDFRDHPQNARLPRPPKPTIFGPAGMLMPRVLDLHERALNGWSASMPWDPDTFPQSARGLEVYSPIRVGSQSVRVFSVPIRLHDHVIGVVQTAAYLTEANAELAHLTRALLTLIPLVLLIAGAGGTLLTGGTLRPIRNITQAANRISAESLSGRLTVSGNDEFSELSSTFNRMLERLEGAFQKLTVAYEQERRFTADASHELRTPLTVIKAHTSLSLDGQPTAAEYRESMEAIDLAVDRTNRLVQSLLLLARSDAGRLQLCLSPVSLAELGAKAAQVTQKTADAAIKICIPDDVPSIEGDPEALLQVLTNVFANAARHTPAGGEITLTARGDETDVVLTVADTGEGIAAEHLPHLFERFYRVESSRSRGKGGTGLGLAICREIIQAHHGTITIKSAVGQGTAVHVRLPRTQPVDLNDLPDQHAESREA